MLRMWLDRDGDLWFEWPPGSGELTCLDSQVARLVSEKFGTSTVAEVEEAMDAPLADLPLVVGRGFPVDVIFAHPDAGYKGGQEHALEHLTPGRRYTVQAVAVGQSSTYLTLYGLPGEQFGSELFEPYWPAGDDPDDNAKADR